MKRASLSSESEAKAKARKKNFLTVSHNRRRLAQQHAFDDLFHGIVGLSLRGILSQDAVREGEVGVARGSGSGG
jgi:hypothetical protein